MLSWFLVFYRIIFSGLVAFIKYDKTLSGRTDARWTDSVGTQARIC